MCACVSACARVRVVDRVSTCSSLDSAKRHGRYAQLEGAGMQALVLRVKGWALGIGECCATEGIAEKSGRTGGERRVGAPRTSAESRLLSTKP